MSNRTVPKMIQWKWLVPMLFEIGRVQAFMMSNRPRKEREKNRKRRIYPLQLGTR